MKSTSALPTEDRVKRMNDVQWVWYYLNILQDEDETNSDDKDKLDYLAFFINPQLAEGINKIKNKENKEIDEKNESNEEFNSGLLNNFFDEELKKALSESGINDSDFTQLPSSEAVGDPNELEQDFFSRVINNQSIYNDILDNPDNEESNDTEEDVDYFEYPDED